MFDKFFPLRAYLFLSLFMGNALFGATATQNLQISDIPRIMQEMLEAHISKKTIDEKSLLVASRVLVEQFDPEKIYLLESEADTYLNPSESTLHEFFIQYQQNNYSYFEKMIDLFQKAILRQRKIRNGLESSPEPLFKDAEMRPNITEQKLLENISKRAFPQDEAALYARAKEDIVEYIQEEMLRFGKKAVLEHEAHILKLYDNEMETFENTYLYRDEQGATLSSKDKRASLYPTYIESVS